MKIGHKIKELRKQRGITQEQLAIAVGVSFQAVSKWENNVALPDISMAPILASYFGVTMDTLFDFSLQEMEDDIERITDEAYDYRETDPQKSRAILEEGLRKYPENDILLNNLLYVLNYTENPDETISIAERLIAQTAQSDVKYDALRFLAYAYKAKGDLAKAEAAIDQIPEIYFTKLTEIAYLATGQVKYEAARKQKQVSFENLLQMMWKIAEYYEEENDIANALAETEKALALIPIMNHPSFDIYRDYFTEQIQRFQELLKK